MPYVSGKKRVVIIDDSIFARTILSDIIKSCDELEIVGMARNGKEGLEMVKSLLPDVVTLDVEMPVMDGLETLQRIMTEVPTPVVMVSSLTTRGAKVSMEALRLGAVDLVAKPHGSHSLGLSAQRDEIISKIISAAHADVSKAVAVKQPPVAPKLYRKIPSSRSFPIVIIASSTGGPRALRVVIPGLATEGVAYMTIQHLPEGFSSYLARDLNSITELNVREVEEGDTLEPGVMLLAKAGYHAVFDSKGVLHLNQDPPKWGVRPSADITMESAAPVFRNRLVAVVLTGMGHDGANGLKTIKMAGGASIAEHESTCVVYGMPRSAVETGAVDLVLPLQHISEAINALAVKTAEGRIQ